MGIYAHIVDSTVAKVGTAPNWFNDAGEPLSNTEWVEHNRYPVQSADPVPDGKVSTGKHVEWDGSQAKWVHELEDITFADAKQSALDALANRRWQVETGGITINAIPIRTDEVGQAKITGAIALFDNDPTLTEVDWEAQPGIWVTLDGATIRTIGVAVGRHIQACFSHARALSEAIQAAPDMPALDAIGIESGWPGQAE